MNKLKVNKILISDDILKVQIDKNGLKVDNIDLTSFPYVRNGLRHNIDINNNIIIDDISDDTIKNIIFPNNSYFKVNNIVSLKPIKTINVDLTSNCYYLSINDNIENLTLTSSNQKHIILSIPNKSFNKNIQNIIIDYLILRDYQFNSFDNNLISSFNPVKVINMTINKTVLLFDTFKLSSIDDVNIEYKHKYYFKIIENMKIKKSIYFKSFQTSLINEFDDFQNVISNIDLDCVITSNNLKFYKNYNILNEFTLNYPNINFVILYNHYGLFQSNNKLIKYDFFNKTGEEITFINNIIEINDVIYSYQITNNEIILSSSLHFKIFENSNVLKFFRCFNNIVCICQRTSRIDIIISSLNIDNFFTSLLIIDYKEHFIMSMNNKQLFIEYTTTSSTIKKLTFDVFNDKELLTKF